MTNSLFENNGAEFSEDRKYRYVLWRIWDESLPKVMVIGLNPSTANENKNDNTISKLKKVGKGNGFGGFYMMNLFAVVSKDPKILKAHKDPLGDNDGWLERIAPKCSRIVFAWGDFKEARERAIKVIGMFENPYCLFQNKSGSPKHPLYCRDETQLIPFNSALLK